MRRCDPVPSGGRQALADRLSRNGAPLEPGRQIALGGDRFVISHDDFHRLSDYLEALVRFGLVKRSRDAGIRLRLPTDAAWDFPPVPFETQLDALTRLVVVAARKASEEDGAREEAP
jgi:hypothetical protein